MITAENLHLLHKVNENTESNEQEDLLGQVDKRKSKPMKVMETTQR